MKKLLTFLCVVLLVTLAFSLSGCSPQERAGVSPLPQNRPAAWETNPYGNLGM